MNLVVVSNPNSGTGNSKLAVTSLLAALQSAGHTVVPLSVQALRDAPSAIAQFKAADVLVIAGGDGTLHHALPLIIESQVAVTHFPLGTENLFARELGTIRSPDALVRALERREIVGCDVGVCNGRHFAIMVSAGFDASVVEQVAAARVAGVSRLDYVRRGLSVLTRGRFPRMSVWVDDQPIAKDESGLVVVANSRHYAARLNPARDANVRDGRLDIVFLSHRTRAGLLASLAATSTGLHLQLPKTKHAQGTRVRITSSPDLRYQLDGESGGALPLDANSRPTLDVAILPGAMRVLLG